MFARTSVRKITSVVCGFSLIKIHFFDYPNSLISRLNEVYVLKKKHNFINNSFFFCNHTSDCVNMVTVTSASRYQIKSSMYIRGLISRNSREFAEAIPIVTFFSLFWLNKLLPLKSGAL